MTGRPALPTKLPHASAATQMARLALAEVPQLQEAWTDLRVQLDWAAGHWVGWLTAERAAIDALVAMSGHHTGGQQLRHELSEDSDVHAILDALLRPDLARTAITWVVCPDRSAGGLARWRRFHLLLNERRERLARGTTGGVVFAGPPGFGEAAREAAPDLWTMRAWTWWVEQGPSSERLEVQRGLALAQDRGQLHAQVDAILHLGRLDGQGDVPADRLEEAIEAVRGELELSGARRARRSLERRWVKLVHQLLDTDASAGARAADHLLAEVDLPEPLALATALRVVFVEPASVPASVPKVVQKAVQPESMAVPGDHIADIVWAVALALFELSLLGERPPIYADLVRLGLELERQALQTDRPLTDQTVVAFGDCRIHAGALALADGDPTRARAHLRQAAHWVDRSPPEARRMQQSGLALQAVILDGPGDGRLALALSSYRRYIQQLGWRHSITTQTVDWLAREGLAHNCEVQSRRLLRAFMALEGPGPRQSDGRGRLSALLAEAEFATGHPRAAVWRLRDAHRQDPELAADPVSRTRLAEHELQAAFWRQAQKTAHGLLRDAPLPSELTARLWVVVGVASAHRGQLEAVRKALHNGLADSASTEHAWETEFNFASMLLFAALDRIDAGSLEDGVELYTLARSLPPEGWPPAIREVHREILDAANEALDALDGWQTPASTGAR